MNELQKEAQKELEELLINRAETGRDREACYPSSEEEEEEGILESVIEGCKESMQLYFYSKLHSDCSGCLLLDTTCIGKKKTETKGLDKLMCRMECPEGPFDEE